MEHFLFLEHSKWCNFSRNCLAFDTLMRIFSLLSFSTGFNRIDLPMYTSKDHLKEKLTVAVMMAAQGFGIE